jgi:hypothetical protein
MTQPTLAQQEQQLRPLRRLAGLLDSALPVPGTRWRIGLDGLIGLVPGIGDLAGAALSSYILMKAIRLGVPAGVVLRMLFNILLEMTLGAIPLIGDLFDFGFKANLRNIRLIERHVDAAANPDRHPRDV